MKEDNPKRSESASAATKAGELAARRRFRSASKNLTEALSHAKEVWPQAELYLAGSTLNLMSGPHHEGRWAKARPDRIIDSIIIPGIDGGDW